MAQLISVKDKALSQLVSERISQFPSSGEINRKVPDAAAAIARVRGEYEGHASLIDETDGISMEYGSWRFNLRSSNTEPVLRLNVESRGDHGLMLQQTERILQLVDAA